MKKHHKLINDHYRQADLSAHIMSVFERAGKQINSHEDTASFDEFHIRGRDATRELAILAGVQKGMKVLDIGCGVGGPARTLAAEFGCHVKGIDLIEEYCQTATDVSSIEVQRTAMEGRYIPIVKMVSKPGCFEISEACRYSPTVGTQLADGQKYC